jgi:hypothetical protein
MIRDAESSALVKDIQTIVFDVCTITIAPLHLHSIQDFDIVTLIFAKTKDTM